RLRRSPQPWLELLLELAAAARRGDRPPQLASLDDADRRHLRDAELLREIRPPLDGDAHEVERVVVLPPLEHLGDEALDAPAAPGERGVEEDEARPRLRLRHRLGLRDGRHASLVPRSGGT